MNDVEIAIVNGVIATFWAQGSLVLTSRSYDLGTTWTAPATLGQGSMVRDISIFVEDQRVHLFWNAGAVHQQRSLDGGVTWMPTAVLLPSPLSVLDPVGHDDTIFSCSSSLQRSFDFGATWQVDNSHGVSNLQGCDIDGDLVVLSGFAAGSQAAQVAISNDRGRTWIMTTLPVPPATNPAVIAQGNTAWVRYVYFAAGELRSSWVVSDDLGASWRSVAADSNQALHVSDHGAIGFHRPRFLSTMPPLRAFPFAGHTSLGDGTAGSGNHVPTHRGRGLALIDAAFDLEVGNALGGAVGAWFFAFHTANTPLGSATLHLDQPVGSAWFTATGSNGVPGAGTAKHTLTIPADPAFAGIRLVSQAFVLDSGAIDGFAATRAIESWIY